MDRAKTEPDGGMPVLAGFLLSGFLMAFLGAILPAWGYHRDPPDFLTVGGYFLALSIGILVSERAARWLMARSLSALLVISAAAACASLAYLAAVGPPLASYWRIGGILVLGVASGTFSTGLLHAIGTPYKADPAGTVNRCGIFFGLGSLAATLLVAGTFNAYTVPSILVFMATFPGAFAAVYSRRRFANPLPGGQPSLREAFRDFRSPAAVLLALLLFFQFGNEWTISGWLPLFLIRRIGLSPSGALMMVAMYWTALLVGRLVAVAVLPRLRHGRLLGWSLAAAMFGCFLLFSTNNVFGAGTGTLLVGVGFAPLYPLVVEKIGYRFPYYRPGFFNGIFSFAMVGATLAPASLGYLAAWLGIGVVMAVPLLGTCMVFVLLMLIWLEAKVTGR